jgi:ferredoxin--NADP+ reductase
LTTELFDAKVGDEVSWIRPTGHMTINDELPNGEPDRRRIVCIGGGTGIAPFVSMVQHLHAVGDKREIVLLHGASYVDELSYKELLTNLENESLDRGADKWNFKYRAAISRPQEWFNRSWTGQVGRVEQFLRATPGRQSPLEELVGEKITKDNTMFYICGWQGTIDGTMDYLQGRDFVTQRRPREDGSYEVKYESYG